MKTKHLTYLLTLVFDIGGYWWIPVETKDLGILGFISIMAIFFTAIIIVMLIMNNWDKKLF